MISKDSTDFIKKQKKWNKYNLWTGLVILLIGVVFLIKYFAEGTRFDLVTYGFICGAGMGMIADACRTIRWLRVMREIEET